MDAKLSFGGEISVPKLETQITTVRTKLATYNQLLSQVEPPGDGICHLLFYFQITSLSLFKNYLSYLLHTFEVSSY